MTTGSRPAFPTASWRSKASRLELAEGTVESPKPMRQEVGEGA
jgi:hypothetical protein